MTDAEKRLLVALVGMCEQYLHQGKDLDHMFMSAGEQALELLTEYGLVEPVPRGGRWTEAGLAFLASH